MNRILLLRCHLFFWGLPFVISGEVPTLWGSPPFIEVLPRREVAYLDPEGANILMDEEIDGEVTLALLNYKGDLVPQILVEYPQNIVLGAELREGEVIEGNKWYLFIKNRQDYESGYDNSTELLFYFAEMANNTRVMRLHINNTDDNPPVITGHTCQVPENFLGLTNCVFYVKDADGPMSLRDTSFSIVPRKGREDDDVFEVSEVDRTEFFIKVTLGAKVELSYEETRLFIFSLKAVDPGKNEGRLTVVIQVKESFPDETSTTKQMSTNSIFTDNTDTTVPTTPHGATTREYTDFTDAPTDVPTSITDSTTDPTNPDESPSTATIIAGSTTVTEDSTIIETADTTTTTSFREDTLTPTDGTSLLAEESTYTEKTTQTTQTTQTSHEPTVPATEESSGTETTYTTTATTFTEDTLPPIGDPMNHCCTETTDLSTGPTSTDPSDAFTDETTNPTTESTLEETTQTTHEPTSPTTEESSGTVTTYTTTAITFTEGTLPPIGDPINH